MDINEATYSGMITIEKINAEGLSGTVVVKKRVMTSLVVVIRKGSILQNVGWVHQQNVVMWRDM